ncbi:MAG: iron-containing alcohol dehydrogenase [Candidatus Auribacterota bacterium]|nr:iron-containing alcohol dehydrogenase [Candidatus Auribacterota bacterium]
MNTISHFEFATSGQIIFGPGTLSEVGPIAAGLGNRACVVTGGDFNRAAGLIKELDRAGISHITLQVKGEPTTDLALRLVEEARTADCNLVIGIGGGSVLDTGKVIAALLTNRGELMDYLEVIGKGIKIELPPAPYIAIPTTAGTGAEVTRNGVLLSPEHRVKVSMRSPLMIPRVALIDPLLTVSMPPAITASTGLDAFTQLLEPFVSRKANPLTDAICREGLARVARSLCRAYKDGENIPARTDMSLAGLFGGLALANAGLGAAHGFAGPLGGMFRAPHGVICARLLPFVMEANIQALRQRAPSSPALSRYREAAAIVTGNEQVTGEDGVEWVKNLCRDLAIPPLAQFGIKADDVTAIVAKAKNSSSMKGNPVELNQEELAGILSGAL